MQHNKWFKKISSKHINTFNIFIFLFLFFLCLFASDQNFLDGFCVFCCCFWHLLCFVTCGAYHLQLASVNNLQIHTFNIYTHTHTFMHAFTVQYHCKQQVCEHYYFTKATHREREREHKKNREFCIGKQIISFLLQYIHMMREVDRMRENNQIKSTIRELSHIILFSLKH